MTVQASKRVLLGFAALMFVAMTLMLVLPAQAHAEPSTSTIYTVDNVDYHPSKDSDGAWYAVVTGCKNTAGITVKETVKLDGTTVPVAAIYPGAFNGKNKVKTLTINAPIEWIPISMCNGCTSLQKVTLKYPDKVTEVNAHAFQGCQYLKSISDLKNVWRIDEEAFFDCRSLEALTTQGLRRLGKSAFRDCMSLTRVSTPLDSNSNEKLKKIPEYAFYGC